MKGAVAAALLMLGACAAPEGEDLPSPDDFVCTTNAYDLTECVPAEPGEV